MEINADQKQVVKIRVKNGDYVCYYDVSIYDYERIIMVRSNRDEETYKKAVYEILDKYDNKELDSVLDGLGMKTVVQYCIDEFYEGLKKNTHSEDDLIMLPFLDQDDTPIFVKIEDNKDGTYTVSDNRTFRHRGFPYPAKCLIDVMSELVPVLNKIAEDNDLSCSDRFFVVAKRDELPARIYYLLTAIIELTRHAPNNK